MNNEQYRIHIDRLIREMSGETVLNGSHAHATIIIERMFANANESMEIVTRRFDPRIFGTPETVEQAELFLGDPARKCSILVEKVDSEALANHPFIARLSRYLDAGNLQIRQMPEHISAAINVNFAVMDSTGFRFEEDKHMAVAVARFGAMPFIDKLKDFFSKVWDFSRNIEIPTTSPSRVTA